MADTLFDWLQSLATPLKTMPFEQAGRNALMKRWEGAQLKMMIDHPDKAMPDVFVITNDKQVAGKLPSLAFSVPAGVGLPQGIYITQDYLAKLNDNEALSILSHEAGHQLLGHGQRVAQAEQKYGHSVPFYTARRKMECEADHAAVYYSDRTSLQTMADFASAIGKGRGNGKLIAQVDKESQHPPDVQRVQKMAQEFLKEHKPGDVQFDRQCNAIRVLTSEAPPSTPGQGVQPDAPPPRQR